MRLATGPVASRRTWGPAQRATGRRLGRAEQVTGRAPLLAGHVDYVVICDNCVGHATRPVAPASGCQLAAARCTHNPASPRVINKFVTLPQEHSFVYVYKEMLRVYKKMLFTAYTKNAFVSLQHAT